MHPNESRAAGGATPSRGRLMSVHQLNKLAASKSGGGGVVVVLLLAVRAVGWNLRQHFVLHHLQKMGTGILERATRSSSTPQSNDNPSKDVVL